MRVPEEINRKIVDHISDINITYSSIAREYLINEGIPPDRVIKIGSPMKEVIKFYERKIESSLILSDLKIKKYEYFLASFHREENINTNNLLKFIQILNDLVNKYKIPVIFSTHPRTRKKLDQLDYKINQKITFLKPQSFSNYLKLQLNSKAVLSDSGTINEEASILNFPALNIREAHERPEAMEEASVMMTGINKDRIIQALEVLSAQKRNQDRTINIVKDYEIDNISEKIIRIIISYTNYIKQNIWKEY